MPHIERLYKNLKSKQNISPDDSRKHYSAIRNSLRFTCLQLEFRNASKLHRHDAIVKNKIKLINLVAEKIFGQVSCNKSAPSGNSTGLNVDSR